MSVLRRMLASASRGESSLRRQQRAAPVIAVHREKCGKVIAGSSRKRQNRLTCLSRHGVRWNCVPFRVRPSGKGY